MGKKFDKIFESVVSRYTSGGYLPGDIVQLRSDYKSCDCYKAMNSVMKKELDELAKSGLNIKVVQVGDRLSGASAGNQHKRADDMVITIGADQGGGRTHSTLTVSANMIDLVDPGNPSPGIPKEFYRDDEKYLNGKAEKYVPDSNDITRVSDKGNGKNTPTDLKLAGESAKATKDNLKLGDILEEMYN